MEGLDELYEEFFGKVDDEVRWSKTVELRNIIRDRHNEETLVVSLRRDGEVESRLGEFFKY